MGIKMKCPACGNYRDTPMHEYGCVQGGKMTRDNVEAALVYMSKWVDNHNEKRDPEARLWGRVSKIGEEFGEVMEALIGYTGQNPRKGESHSKKDVLEELLDVAITALGAYEHMTGHLGISIEKMEEKIIATANRAQAHFAVEGKVWGSK